MRWADVIERARRWWSVRARCPHGNDLGTTIVASFWPRDIDTLRTRAHWAVGYTGAWRWLWHIEPDDDQRYAGQDAWEPEDRSVWFGWVPTEDLEVGG